MSEPRDAMSEARLEWLRTYCSEAAWVPELLAEVERLRASAQLGSALVEALREVEPGEGLELDPRDDLQPVVLTNFSTWGLRESDATRALASLLAAFPQESR